jgi:galactose-1-phosphate uridylyltransferase
LKPEQFVHFLQQARCHLKTSSTTIVHTHTQMYIVDPAPLHFHRQAYPLRQYSIRKCRTFVAEFLVGMQVARNASLDFTEDHLLKSMTVLL